MSRRRLWFWAWLGVAVVLLAFTMPRLLRTLALNKAQFLVNQHKWDEAQRIVESVSGEREVASRAQRLLATIELHTGQYAQALERLAYQVPTATTEFDRAVCLYEMDREMEAREAFEKARAQLEDLPPELQPLASIASEALADEPVAFDKKQPENLPRAYKVVWQSLRGRVAFARKELEDARLLVEQALLLGDQNTTTRRIALILTAIQGDLARAQKFADAQEQPHVLLSQALHELTALEDGIATKSVALEVGQTKTRRRREIAIARAWLLSRIGAQEQSTTYTAMALQIVDDVLANARQDLTAILLKADLLTELHRQREAYVCLRDLANWHTTYRAYLREMDLLGEQPSVSAAKELFADHRGVLRWVSANELATTGGVQREGYLAFFTRGSCGSSLEVPMGGTYFVNVVARGDCAFGLCPRLLMRLDGKVIGEIYVAREGWDCYSVRTTIEEGWHTLTLEYLNNSERLLSNEEDRNLYLQSVIITKAEIY